jgi:hypothetical protein
LGIRKHLASFLKKITSVELSMGSNPCQNFAFGSTSVFHTNTAGLNNGKELTSQRKLKKDLQQNTPVGLTKKTKEGFATKYPS